MKYKDVEITQFFSEVYRDNLTRELDEKYGVSKTLDLLKNLSLLINIPIEKKRLEKIVVSCLYLGSLERSFIGLKKGEFLAYLNRRDNNNVGERLLAIVLEEGYLRRRKIKKEEVIFPTEKIIEEYNEILLKYSEKEVENAARLEESLNAPQ